MDVILQTLYAQIWFKQLKAENYFFKDMYQTFPWPIIFSGYIQELIIE